MDRHYLHLHNGYIFLLNLFPSVTIMLSFRSMDIKQDLLFRLGLGVRGHVRVIRLVASLIVGFWEGLLSGFNGI